MTTARFIRLGPAATSALIPAVPKARAVAKRSANTSSRSDSTRSFNSSRVSGSGSLAIHSRTDSSKGVMGRRYRPSGVVDHLALTCQAHESVHMSARSRVAFQPSTCSALLTSAHDSATSPDLRGDSVYGTGLPVAAS